MTEIKAGNSSLVASGTFLLAKKNEFKIVMLPESPIELTVVFSEDPNAGENGGWRYTSTGEKSAKLDLLHKHMPEFGSGLVDTTIATQGNKTLSLSLWITPLNREAQVFKIEYSIFSSEENG